MSIIFQIKTRNYSLRKRNTWCDDFSVMCFLRLKVSRLLVSVLYSRSAYEVFGEAPNKCESLRCVKILRVQCNIATKFTRLEYNGQHQAPMTSNSLSAISLFERVDLINTSLLSLALMGSRTDSLRHTNAFNLYTINSSFQNLSKILFCGGPSG